MSKQKHLKSFIDAITPLANKPGPHQGEAGYVIGWYYAVYNPEQYTIAERYLKIGLHSQYANSGQRLARAYQKRLTLNQTVNQLREALSELSQQPLPASKIQHAIGILYYDNRVKNKKYTNLATEAFEQAIQLDSNNHVAFKALNEILSKRIESKIG